MEDTDDDAVTDPKAVNAEVMLWIFLEYTVQAGKYFPTLGPFTTPPSTSLIPPSSNYQTCQSCSLFTGFASLSPSPIGAPSASPTGTRANKSAASGAGVNRMVLVAFK